MGRAPRGVEGTDHFFMFRYKILTCPRRHSHDWTSCPYAHSGESARRRDPSVYRPIPCPESKSGRPCPRGDSCKYAHNDFEYWLHPTRYCTEYCKQGPGCRRKVCFFAHNPSELRKPADIIQTLSAYGWLKSPDKRRGRHERKSSLSSVESSDTGLCYQSIRSLSSTDPLIAQSASPSSCGSDLDLSQLSGTMYGSEESPRTGQAGKQTVEERVVGGGLPHDSVKYVSEVQSSSGFVGGDYSSVATAAQVKQRVLDEVTSALAGCSADGSILESMDPNTFLSASAGLSLTENSKSRSSGSPTVDHRPSDRLRSNRVAACLKVLMDELEKDVGEEALLANSRARGGTGGRGHLADKCQRLHGVPLPRVTSLEQLVADSLATATGSGQQAVDSSGMNPYDHGWREEVTAMDPFLLDHLLQAASRNNIDGQRDGPYPELAYQQVRKYGMAGPVVVQTPSPGGDLSAANGIIASLGMNFEENRKENDNLNFAFGAAPHFNYAASADVAPISAAKTMGLTLRQVGSNTQHQSTNASQLGMSNWELAKSLGIACGPAAETGVSFAETSPGLMRTSLHPLTACPQEASVCRLMSGFDMRASDALTLGVPSGPPLCR